MRRPYAVHAACATKSERTDLYPEDRLKIAQDMILAKFNMNKKKTNDMRSRTHDTTTTAAPASCRNVAWALQILGAKGDRAAPATLVVVCDATHHINCVCRSTDAAARTSPRPGALGYGRVPARLLDQCT